MSARERAGASWVALGSLVVTLILAAAKLLVGALTGSIALLSDGVQSSLDVGATATTLFAVTVARKPPDREHPFGHGRAENLAALGEAVLMAVAGAWLLVEAVSRLMTGTPLDVPWYAMAVVGFGMAIDTSRVFVLRRAARRYQSPALEADAMNFTGDVLASGAVFVGLVLTAVGFPAADPVAAVIVVVVMWGMAVRVGAKSVQALMDRAPTDDLDERIVAAARSVDGVVGVEGVRVRRAGPQAHAELTVSVGRTHSVERSHDIARTVERTVEDAVIGTQAVVRVAPSGEGEDIVGRTFAAANRVGLADQVHNVLAISHPEGIWLMLHAKVPADTPLSRAHDVSDILERELRAEIGGLARVEIHIEPREAQHLRGAVVSALRDDIISECRRIAGSHHPIVRCHEVAVSEVGDGLHVVLHCEASAERSIEEIHDASLKAEDEIHRRFGEVRTVTIHFEPETPTDGA